MIHSDKDKKWCIVLIVLLLITIFIKPILASLISIILYLLFLKKIIQDKEAVRLLNARRKDILFLSLLYLVAVVWLYGTDSENIKVGFRKLETQLSLILFPIIFSVYKFKKKDINKIIEYSMLGLVLTIVGYIVYFFLFRIESNFSLNDLLVYLNDSFHRTYISMYFLFFGCIYILHHNKNKIKVGIVLISVILITQLFESRISLLVIPILMIVLAFIINNKTFNLSLILSFVITFLFFSIAIIPNSERAKDKIENYRKILVDPNNDDIYNAEGRIIAWIGAYDVIRKNVWFGVGTGDGKHEVKKATTARNFKLKYQDVHNQFLDYWVRYGIVGIVILLTAIIYPFYLSIINKDYDYIIFLIIICFFFSIENIITRQMGVMFYAIFNTIYYYKLSDVK